VAITSMLVIDVGGAGLALEVQTSGFSRAKDKSGESVKRALGGGLLVTRVYAQRPIYQGVATKALTTDELAALLAAAQWPKTIVVGGDALRLDAANTTPQTVNAKVDVDVEDYQAVGGTDFLHVAHVTVLKAD
jgi:hypothetical protein